MSGFKLPGLSISSNPVAFYYTKLKANEIGAIQQRLYNFNYDLPIDAQYAEIESIANVLKNAQENERDEMELGNVLASLDAQRRGKRVDKPGNLVSVLLKVAERITTKPAAGGRRKTMRNKKGGTRKKLPKSNTPEFRKQVIDIIMSRPNLTNTHKALLIQRYIEAANAGLATPDEISALVGLAELKYYHPSTMRRRK